MQDYTPKMIEQLYLDGMSLSQIAKNTGCPKTQVYKIIKKAGINRSVSQGNLLRYGRVINEKQIIELYCKSKLSCQKISKLIHVAHHKVKNILIKNNIALRTRKCLLNINDCDVVQSYVEDHLSLHECAEKFNVSRTCIRQRLIDNNIQIRSSHEKLYGHKKQLLIKLYNNRTMWDEIEKQVEVDRKECRDYLIKWGIPKRGKNSELSPAWRGGISQIHQSIRKHKNYIDWRDKVFQHDDYKSIISHQNDYLHAHHMIPFTKILHNVLIRNLPLKNTQYYDDCISSDKRFFDPTNGISLLKNEHHMLEHNTSREGLPEWRLYKTFNYNPNNYDFSNVNDDGLVCNNNFTIKIVNRKFCLPYIFYHHYLGTIPYNTKLYFAAFSGDFCIGVITFGSSGNRHISKEIMELTRLCIPYYVDKKNLASRLISRCIKYIKTNHYDIKQIISYADTSVGHSGGIYRACSWKEIGQTKKDYCYYDLNNKQLVHKSRCRRKKGIDKTEKEWSKEYNFVKIPLAPKIKFIKTL